MGLAVGADDALGDVEDEVRALPLQAPVSLVVRLDENDLVAFPEGLLDRCDRLVRIAFGEHVVGQWRLVLLVLALVGATTERRFHTRFRAI